MSDLSDELLREWAAEQEGGYLPSSMGYSLYAGAKAERNALARQVMALRVTLAVLDGSACAEEQANGNGPCGVCKVCLREQIATLTRQRDEAVAVARELETIVARRVGLATCHEQSARLDAITGEGQ